jgi:hypothetical protein
MTSASQVLQLKPIAAPPEHCTIDFCGEQRCQNPTHYADLIYEAGQNRFWLLREHTLNKLVAAADDLKKNLLTTDPDSRINALNDAGLLEPFLEPKASSFLEAPESQRYLEIERTLTNIRSRIERTQAEAKEQNGVNIDNTPHVSSEQSRLIGECQRDYHTLQRELAALDAKGHTVARDRGYRFENGHLYSAEALRAREIIQRYLKQRQKLLDVGTPHFSEQDIKQFTQEQDQWRAQADPANHAFIRSERDIAEWVRHSTGKFHYSELVKTLLEAAAYGLALPEYALKGDNEDIQEGFRKYEEYHNWLRTKAKLDKGVEASFNHWANVTKQAPPSSLFAQEEDHWRALEAKEADLKKAAEDFVNRSQPRRHLLWNPEQFAPQPQQRLVRTDFPLREISVPTEVERLRHLSFNAVLKDLNERTQALLKKDYENALAHAQKPSVKLAAGDAADPDLFSTWLKMHDARPIEIQDGWFDRHGFFLPDRFKRYIKDEKLYIDNLRDDATFDAWGKDLRQMLFKQSTLGPLRLFDNSPQARLVRCLTPTDSSVKLASQLQTPNVSLKKGLGASANVTLDVKLAQGEIDVASFELPGRSEAQVKVLSYQNENNLPAGSVNVGKFCLTGSLKAWGFAGASMMLSANLRVGPNKKENDDLSIDTGRDAERKLSRAETGLKPHIRHDDALGGQFNLFAGVQAGIKIKGSLLWAPPSDLLTLKHPVFGQRIDKDGWLELATLGIDASAALGVGTKAGLVLSLQNGLVIMRMDASIVAGTGVQGAFNFVVSYKAIIQILDIFNKALVENNYKKMEWVTPDAFEYFSQLQVLASLGVDIQWAFLRGYNVVRRIYDAIKAGDRAGAMAHDIVQHREEIEFKQFYSNLTPEGLGSLLATMLSTPKAFTVDEGGQKKLYTPKDAHLVQQQAIEIILTSIYENAISATSTSNTTYENLAAAQVRFGKAIVRFASSEKPDDPNYIYNRNVYRMNIFMAANAGEKPEDYRMQARYVKARNRLGEIMDATSKYAIRTQLWNPEAGSELAPWTY